jgi:glutamine synthetase
MIQPKNMKRRVIADYVFVDGDGKFRTKNRVDEITGDYLIFGDFSTDGSSTGQTSESGNTEIILRPVFTTRNPLRTIESYIVLCETYDAVTNEPLPSNSRADAAKFFRQEDVEAMDIWFGPEQEYYFRPMILRQETYVETGSHYCGIQVNPVQQQVVEKHLEACMMADLNFYGTNAEVSQDQWEFQLGPCSGIVAADQLMVARFLLEKIAANYGYNVCYDPKPFKSRHGSGCHINFSTNDTRMEETGAENIVKLMPKFLETHQHHIDAYGEGNELRLTGKCETASIAKFSFGVGTRNTSMRISNKVMQNKCGYVEDRRPAANVDPYKAMLRIAQTLKETKVSF